MDKKDKIEKINLEIKTLTISYNELRNLYNKYNQLINTKKDYQAYLSYKELLTDIKTKMKYTQSKISYLKNCKEKILNKNINNTTYISLKKDNKTDIIILDNS
jgi:ferritin-like metal-binding protein YciE